MNLNTFEEKVRIFNRVCGSLTDVDDTKLTLQLSLIKEELKELEDAFKAKDSVEVLDGIVDVLVTAVGFAQQLQTQGYDVSTATQRVADNNLTKFPKDVAVALESVNHYVTIGVPASYSFNDNAKAYVVKRDSDLKVMKPVNYVPVVLGDLVPPMKANGGW